MKLEINTPHTHARWHDSLGWLYERTASQTKGRQLLGNRALPQEKLFGEIEPCEEGVSSQEQSGEGHIQRVAASDRPHTCDFQGPTQDVGESVLLHNESGTRAI